MNYVPKTPVTFSREEAEQVRAAVLKHEPDVACPRCGVDMERMEIVEDRHTLVLEVFCPDCHRAMLVRDPE